jgi:hypothetical protein
MSTNTEKEISKLKEEICDIKILLVTILAEVSDRPVAGVHLEISNTKKALISNNLNINDICKGITNAS